MVVRNNMRRGQVRRIPNRRKAIERIVRINKVGDSKSSDRPGSTPPVLYRNLTGLNRLVKTSNYNEWSTNTMSNITKKFDCSGILTALIAASAATAADVPAGVQLADKQTLVRNNGSSAVSRPA